ncbi:hypothetical protein KEJ21_02965 [Candidatus Bathyarchaeota archaeon]|nr:hypothetical protein [Candidatus Bathyarchaeota archaeon]MBS7630974.1 hypothetical protein [Candidatus Bathyarchaeota archaeon]
MMSAPFIFFAPIYTGWMCDTAGSYATPFTIFSFLIVVSALIICLASPRKSQQANSYFFNGPFSNLVDWNMGKLKDGLLNPT